MKLKERIKIAKDEIKTKKEVIKLAEIILNANSIINNMNTIIYDKNFVIEPYGLKEFQKCRKALRKIFNNYTDKIWSVGCPNNDILARYHTNIPRLDIWVNYENEEDLPKSITKNGKCKIKEITIKEKRFICEKK